MRAEARSQKTFSRNKAISVKPKKSLKAAPGKRKKVARKSSLSKKPLIKKAPAKIAKRASRVAGRKEKPSAGELIGVVTHYFPQVNVAALKIEKRGLMAGETLYFHGHTTKFKTVIKSMQINRKPVLSASVGDEIGVLVPRRVRAGDQVFFQA